MNNQSEKALPKQSPRLIIKPSEALLENWRIWIALEAIKKFKYGVDNTAPLSIEFVVNELYIDFSKHQKKFSDLQKILDKQSLVLKQECSSLENLLIAKKGLEKFYISKILSKLELINQDINSAGTFIIKKTVRNKARHSAPIPTLAWLTKLSKIFQEKRKQYAQNRLDYFEQESASIKAFDNLAKIADLDQETNLESNLSNAWNAVVWRVKSMLWIEEQKIFEQIFCNLIHLCQIFTEYSESSLAILQNIEKSLSQKASISLISLPVFERMKKFNVLEQQKALEVWIGHCINYWGNAPVSRLQIENKLLENLAPIADSIFDDFYHCFIEHLIVQESDPP